MNSQRMLVLSLIASGTANLVLIGIVSWHYGVAPIVRSRAPASGTEPVPASPLSVVDASDRVDWEQRVAAARVAGMEEGDARVAAARREGFREGERASAQLLAERDKRIQSLQQSLSPTSASPPNETKPPRPSPPRRAALQQAFSVGGFSYRIEEAEWYKDNRGIPTSGGELVIVRFTFTNETATTAEIENMGSRAHIKLEWDDLVFDPSQEATDEVNYLFDQRFVWTMTLQPRIPFGAWVAFEVPRQALERGELNLVVLPRLAGPAVTEQAVRVKVP